MPKLASFVLVLATAGMIYSLRIKSFIPSDICVGLAVACLVYLGAVAPWMRVPGTFGWRPREARGVLLQFVSDAPPDPAGALRVPARLGERERDGDGVLPGRGVTGDPRRHVAVQPGLRTTVHHEEGRKAADGMGGYLYAATTAAQNFGDDADLRGARNGRRGRAYSSTNFSRIAATWRGIFTMM